jgi:hypothetical protein
MNFLKRWWRKSKTSTVPIVQKAFQFFEAKNISFNEIAKRFIIISVKKIV